MSNYACMVPVEWLAENFKAVEDTIELQGKAVIIVKNMPKYIITRVSAKRKTNTIVVEHELATLLNGIGKRIFVQYYENFKNNDDPFAFLYKEDFTDNSKRSRMSKARAIFKNGWEKAALEMIIASNRADERSKAYATSLYSKYFEGGKYNETVSLRH